jgi:phosphoadenosine phosphosulfate reductase
MQNQIDSLLKETNNFTAEQIIAFSYKKFGDRIVFASSLGEEDQVITDIISHVAPQMGIFTLDTGRLFQETYDLLAKTQKRYPMPIKIYYPNTQAVEAMVKEKGINLFYESVDNRKLCCGVRKVEPLHRALANADAWMTGLRRDQAVTRTALQTFEWDEGNQKIKINPLANWRLEHVHQYIKEHHVDVSPLHAQGFISIGCASCTRAVKPGEDIRTGRWWWENPEQKECGLHNNPKWKKKE